MVLIGLTGGIGMGKSTVAEYLTRSGEKIVDTDVLARQFVQPGEPALEEIRAAFGESVFAGGRSLDRKVLAKLVFSSPDARKSLETILHPRIRAGWRAQAEKWRVAGEKRAVVVIPLLYETGAEAELDRVICVACSRPAQQERLRARGWTLQEIEQRCAAQWPIAKKMDCADGVIWNESTKEVCAEQCKRLFEMQ